MPNSAVQSLQRRILSKARPWFLERTADLIMQLMSPRVGYSVLDLGGSSGGLMLALKARGLHADFVVADLYSNGIPPNFGKPDLRFVKIAEDDTKIPFSDGQFDLVICNAVIEHVTLPNKTECNTPMSEAEWRTRSFANQRRFADEIDRISRSFFVRSPHRDFPINSHLWLPCTNWFPHPALVRLTRVTDRWWIKYSYGVDWNLLRTSDMRILPGCPYLYRTLVWTSEVNCRMATDRVSDIICCIRPQGT